MNETSITRITFKTAQQSEDLTDWKQVQSLSESDIKSNALSDPNNQPLSLDTMKHLKRVKRVYKGQ